MRGNELLDKMEFVDFSYVEAAGAATEIKKKKSGWQRWGAVAASLCILVVATGALLSILSEKEPTPPTIDEPPVQSGGYHGDGSPTEKPQKIQSFVYNEVVSTTEAERVNISGYFTEELAESEIASVVPYKRMEWMEYTGTAGFSGTGALMDVRLKTSSSVPDSPIFVTMSENGTWKDYSVQGEAVLSECNGVVYTVYQYAIGKNRIALEAETKIGECFFLFGMNVASGDIERAKFDFEQVLECFSMYEAGTPNLAAITPDSIPEYFDQRLTLAEAKKDTDFGAYMLKDIPEGFTAESIRRYKDQNNNYLSGLWTNGYAELRWKVSVFAESDAARITEVAEKENYDLSLYPIPRAESVPEELREIVDDPIFLAEELTLEAVFARAYQVDEVGDSDGWRMAFSVKYGDIVVRVNTKGVEPEWVYERLAEMGSKQFSD